MDNSVRIVLVGKTGVGKSSTANTIFGKKVFVSQSSARSVTSECAQETGKVGAHSVTLVDTPGLFDTSVSNDVIANEIGKCVTILAPGPDVFFIVVAVGRFTEEEKETVHLIQQIFGEDIGRFAIVLLTRGDDLAEDGVSIEHFLDTAGSDLMSLIGQCHGRYHALNNRSNDRQQIVELMQKVQALKKKNGRCYTSGLFQMATKVRELERKIEEEKKKGSSDITRLMAINAEMQIRMQAMQTEITKSMNRSRCTIS